MKLSPTMIAVLKHIVNDENPYQNCRGRAEHGGMSRSIMALRKRGLIAPCKNNYYREVLTDAGAELIKELQISPIERV